MNEDKDESMDENKDGDDGTSDLRASDIIVDFSRMHYGMQDKNPLDSIEWYASHSPNGEWLSHLC